jgi:threonine synthase
VQVCERCFGPLEVQYRYDVLTGHVTRERIAAGPASMWRYRDLLPLDGEIASGAHTGLTPLVRARHLGHVLGVRELWIKNEAASNPTGSFKDRVVAVATAKARDLGFDTVACASTGNLAAAVAAHAAQAGMRAYVLVPAALEAAKLVTTLAYGPTVIAVDGSYDDANRLSVEIADTRPWAFVNVNLKPYYSEGAKTLAYEIVEQLGWRTPDHVVLPCAGGSLLAKVWQGITELGMLGLVDRVGTRVHAAQPTGCRPIVTMVEDGTEMLVPVRPRTIVSSLAMGNPPDASAAYRAVKTSGGGAAHASDEEVVDAMRLLAETEGILTEPAGGVAVAVTRRLIDTGRIRHDESVVIGITGTGLTTSHVIAERVGVHATIPPTRSAFDDALADLTRTTSEETSAWR